MWLLCPSHEKPRARARASENQRSSHSLVGLGAQSPPHLQRPSPAQSSLRSRALGPLTATLAFPELRGGDAREDVSLGVCGVRRTCRSPFVEPGCEGRGVCLQRQLFKNHEDTHYADLPAPPTCVRPKGASGEGGRALVIAVLWAMRFWLPGTKAPPKNASRRIAGRLPSNFAKSKSEK